MTSGELHDLTLAAFLHDIGISMLPRHLNIGINRLDCESYVTVQNHPRIGALLLEPFFFLREASVLIAHHHERWDGSGYHYGIRGRFIPLGARGLAIADAYDTITAPNHNPGTRHVIALRILRVASGTQCDPALVATTTKIVFYRDRMGEDPALSEWEGNVDLTR